MLNIKVDDKSVRSMLGTAQRQLPFAMSKGVNDIATGLQKHLYGVMPSVIDRPTRYTLNSLKVTKGNKQNPAASVWFKQPEKHSTHYLEPMVYGKDRRMKGFEKALDKRFYVPGKAAAQLGMIDQHGNFKRGEIQRILSWFGRAEGTSGYKANMTDATRAKRIKMGRSEGGKMLSKRQLAKDPKRGFVTIGGYQYFMSMGKGSGSLGQQHLATGVWRKSGIHGSKLEPVLMASRTAPTYRKQFDFFGIAQKWADANGARIMAEAVDYALRTAR